MIKRRKVKRKSKKRSLTHKQQAGVVAVAIIWGLLTFGIAGQWDYQQQLHCETDMECQQEYKGDDYGY